MCIYNIIITIIIIIIYNNNITNIVDWVSQLITFLCFMYSCFKTCLHCFMALFPTCLLAGSSQ